MPGVHLTLEERKSIQFGLDSCKSKTEIAVGISKSASTVSKEIKRYKIAKPSNLYGRGPCGFCIHVRSCKDKRKGRCLRFEEFCERLKHKGVCNGCGKRNICRQSKYYYNAASAHKSYRFKLSDTRQGVNLTEQDKNFIAQILSPLLKQGQSLYQIHTNHPEIKLSIKTLYTYIESGIFKESGINNFSLRRQVSMKARKKTKPRKTPANYKHHTYDDYIKFKEDNPDIPTTEMDTLYNEPSGPYIQTFMFQNCNLMLGFLHSEKTSASMASVLDRLEEKLGKKDYSKLFSLLLTDRGTEFAIHNLFEYNKKANKLRSNIFYCNPQKPSEKPHVETNHNYVRDIFPNAVSFKGITQEDVDIAMAHINSTPRKSLNGRTPYEMFKYLFGTKTLDKLAVKKIEKDKVILTPQLLPLLEKRCRLSKAALMASYK